MVSIDGTAAWAANSVFNAAGLVATLTVCETIFAPAYRRDVRRLAFLLPAIALLAWLAGAFNAAFATAGPTSAASYGRMALDVAVWTGLSLAFLSLRRFLPFGKTLSKQKAAPFVGNLAPGASEVADTELRTVTERFLSSVDKVDIPAIEAAYDPDFVCVRVADSGGFAHLSREQMLSFLSRAVSGSIAGVGSTTIPTRETAVHHAEILKDSGDIGIVLLTRVKNLGSGWEPLFYALLWKRQAGEWRLLREFVHQRTAPNWRQRKRKPMLTLSEETLEPNAPVADALPARSRPLSAYTPWLTALLRDNLSLALTLAYLLLTAIGIVYEYFLYRFFGIQILDYTEASDFLFAAFREPLLLLFSVASLLFLGFLISVDEKAHRTSEKYAALSLKIEASSWYSNEAMYVLVLVSYFTLLTFFYASVTSSRIRAGKYKTVVVQMITDTSDASPKPGKRPAPTILIGATSKYLFLYRPKERIAQILPVSSMLRIIVP